MIYEWDFTAVLDGAGLLLQGLAGTAILSICSIVFGLVVGALLATARLRGGAASSVARLIIGFYRNTPPIIHFFWFFYALPVISSVELDPFMAAWLALGTQSGAFYAEVFRGGIVAVPRGQWEGSQALGIPQVVALRRIILPQAMRRMIPPFVERSFELTKTTALASTLAYGDLLYNAMQLNAQTFRPLEVFTCVALLYFIMLFTVSKLASLWERHVMAEFA
ncbi:amino acid ABC transporter permease [Sphingobium sp. H39-3-25]|uniref:amino acid ABC transporter permease n=1 Tax=Sphingobium arseniciresistens TaxID=3030834 RepID=UPI0023B8942B|nr:amino acid ABC transporter permease [Sphingobium arseniciresistens]